MATTHGRPVDLGDVPDMLQQVGQALLQSLEVLRTPVSAFGTPPLYLQGADGGNEDDRSWASARPCGT